MINKMPEIISGICVKWQSESPFFAEFLLRFLYTEDENVGTCGISMTKRHRIEFVYNNKFISSLEKNTLEGVLVHEILHILHHFRERQEGRDFQIFNVAQDACINETVINSTIGGTKLKIPKDGVFVSKIREMGYEGKVITEPIYEFLYEKADKITVSMIGPDGEGQSCSDCNGSGKNEDGEKCESCGGSGKSKGGDKKQLSTVDNHGTQKELNDVDKQAIEEVIKNAKTRSWGSISGDLKTEINELIKTKRIPWRQKLRMMMTKYVNEPGNIYENTWSKRNRRSLPLPGIRKKSKQLVLTMDTSGSVGDDDIAKFFGQIEKIVKDYSRLTIIEWDTQIHNVYKYNKGDWKKIKATGRGGTEIQPVYDYLKENLPRTSLVINFTDGYFDWNIQSYNIDTIWAFVNNDMRAPFGKTIHIIDEE